MPFKARCRMEAICHFYDGMSRYSTHKFNHQNIDKRTTRHLTMNIISLFLLGISTSVVIAKDAHNMINTNAPVAEDKSPTLTESTADPTYVYVCGEKYFDAESNCSTNMQCPTGDECVGGTTCFAVPYARCTTDTAAGAKERFLRGHESVEDTENVSYYPSSGGGLCRTRGVNCFTFAHICCSGICIPRSEGDVLGQCA